MTDDAFAQIFNQKRGHRVQDVLSTLSQTVDDLEQPLSKMNLRDNQQQAEDGSTQLTFKRADGTDASVHLQFNTMSGHMLPYTPPPPPQPMSDAQVEVEAEADAAAAVAEQEPQTRVYKAMITIEETVDADGQYKVVAHSPELVDDSIQPRSFLERMALRQMRFEDAQAQQGRTMHAMSVQRKRKLKMKKKKYKKLMRKTRNIRRRQDRL